MANTLYDYYTGQRQKLPSVAERSKIYETSGLGSASEYQGTATQNTSLLNYLNKPVDFNSLGNTPDVEMPTPPTPQSGDTLMAGINGMNQTVEAQRLAKQEELKQYQQDFQDASMFQGVNPAEQTYDTSVQGLIDLQGKSQEASKKKAELYQTNTSDLQKRLDALDLQSSQLKGSYLQGLTDIEGKVMPMRFITGQQAQLQRQYATQAASIALEQQTLQGNIENAKSIADQMIQMEYGDIEQQIAYQKDIIDLNYKKLTTAEQKKADELKYILDQQQAKIEEEKATKTDVNNLLVEAIKNNAPSSVQNAIKNAKTVEEAAMAASSYLGDDKTDFGVIGQDADGNNIYGFINKTNKTVTGINGQPSTSTTDNVFVTSASADEIADAIKQVESGGDYNAKGASGESGAYQFMPDTWNSWSREYAKSVGISDKAKILQSQEMQDAVAKFKIQQWLDNGLSPQQIAAKWNSGSEIGWENKKGVNKQGVAYDVPAYVNKVNNALGGNETILTGADKIAQDIFDGVSNLNVNTLSTKIKEKVQNKLSELKREALKGGDTESIIRASAGGKEVDASTLTSFDKAINVIYQVSDLQETFKQDKGKITNQDGTTTKFDLNPIIGVIRSKNPYDTKAQMVKAQLQAIVPNLARGIYGEVGVLTDNDIKNYSQTLPTLTSTEDVRQAVLGITIRSIQRSIENKLKSQASGGRDVSGFLGQYQEVKSIADSLLGETTNNNQTNGVTWKSTSGKSYTLPY